MLSTSACVEGCVPTFLFILQSRIYICGHVPHVHSSITASPDSKKSSFRLLYLTELREKGKKKKKKEKRVGKNQKWEVTGAHNKCPVYLSDACAVGVLMVQTVHMD